MSVTTQPRTWHLPPSLPEDLAAFSSNVTAFQAGTLSPTQFLVFRVPQGVYEQREAGAYMLRVRFPSGVILPHQLRRLADVSRTFGDGVLHVTTRQDVQIHRVRLEHIHPALVSLAEAGLSTKGGGGNTVRNITGCPHAGVCVEEAFDVTPHALALTERLLPDPKSFQLPRKFKVAFSGCGRDCSGATVSDVGLIARREHGVEGFTVYVAGGLGATSRVGEQLEPFVPATEIPQVVEALKRVFDAKGNRRDKRQARLRFLVRQLGLPAFRQLYEEQRTALRREGIPSAAPAVPEFVGRTAAPGPVPAPADAPFARWLKNSVAAQKQAGFFRVELPLELGDIPARNLEALADVVERFGEKALRATQRQNFVLRWVPGTEIARLYESLRALRLADSRPPAVQQLVACTGAATCKLGLCLSRGLARAIEDAAGGHADAFDRAGSLQINISGCPNSCGRHPIAHIGLHGAARRVDGRLVPHYAVLLGGRVEEGRTALAKPFATLPARNVPVFVTELLELFARSAQHPDFHAFVDAAEAQITELAARHAHVPDFRTDRNYYYDFGAEEPFSLAGRGPGECGAGVYDLIDVDLKSAAEAIGQRAWYSAAALASRALLVTRGEQAKNDAEAFDLFRRHFIDEGLVDGRFRGVAQRGSAATRERDPAAAFAATDAESETTALVSAVQALFASMDASLQFPKRSDATACQAPTVPPSAAPAEPAAAIPTDAEKDFRGVVCPLNYVKTKLALDRLKSGQTLAVLLDAEGARNVPESAIKDGHTVLLVAKENSWSRVILRKR